MGMVGKGATPGAGARMLGGGGRGTMLGIDDELERSGGGGG